MHFDDNINAYLQHIELMNSEDPDERTNGAIFLGVVRGKLSEGTSFPDDGCRCVIVIGQPYPNIKDSRVIMKQHYLETKIDSEKD